MSTPLLLIGLDAAEPRLIEQWIAEGSLPNLRRLRERGAYGRIASSADWLAGSPWPTFYTGTSPSVHGFYHHLRWRSDLMRSVRPSAESLPLAPFWRSLGSVGLRAVALDIPMTYAAGPFSGVEVSGWASHDGLVPPSAYPAEIMEWVGREVGPSPRRDEEYLALPVRRALEIRDELTRSTALVSKLAAGLLRRERSDLFIVAFSATHRGGHQLWDETSLAESPNEADRAALKDALRQIYISCDAAVGRLVAEAGDGAALIFSLHGMGPETSRVDVLPEMLRRILTADSSGSGQSRGGLLKRARHAVPDSWRHAIKHRLPVGLQDRLTAFWRQGGTDWSRTRAFCQVADLHGYIRINLKGREASGIVEPGAEYDALCDRIAEGLKSWVDADTGEPVVREVVRSDRLFRAGARRAELPDLIIGWAQTPVAAQRALVAPTMGRIEMPTPGRNPTGRSGNHRPHGFLIAVGPGFEPGSHVEGSHILDLAPTVHAMLGLAKPATMGGNDIRRLGSTGMGV